KSRNGNSRQSKFPRQPLGKHPLSLRIQCRIVNQLKISALALKGTKPCSYKHTLQKIAFLLKEHCQLLILGFVREKVGQRMLYGRIHTEYIKLVDFPECIC